jgi:ABC-type bacteriocin/lantibiotic exporter with double-glycine peptidase domain
MFCRCLGALFLLFVVPSVFASVNDSERKASSHRKIEKRQMCGQYCLAKVLRRFGKNVELQNILTAIPPTHTGSTLEQLKLVAESYGIETLGLSNSNEVLFKLNIPAILHVNNNHFIAFLPDKQRERYLVVDPPKGYLVHNLADITERWEWNGSCLLMNDGKITLPMKSNYPLYQIIIVCASGIIAAVLSAARFARKRRSHIIRSSSFAI